MGLTQLQPRDEGADSCRPRGRLRSPTPVPGHPLRGRRVPGDAQLPRLQDARGPRQTGQGSSGMLRPAAATPTLPRTPPRAPTTLTTERTPAAMVPLAGTPTTPYSLLDITKPNPTFQDLRVSPSTVILTE